VTILHREAVDDSVTAQLKSVFQTVITVTDTCVSLNELNQFTSLNLKDVYKYHVEIENRNFKKGKVYSYVNKNLFIISVILIGFSEAPVLSIFQIKTFLLF
jgi:hypothetical protein